MKTGVDLSRLRHPHERAAWLVAALLNLAIWIFAVVFLWRGGELLLAEFPRLAEYAPQIHAIAVAAALAPPALVFTRKRRLARVRGDAVKVTPTQYPLIHERYRAQCAKLQVDHPPDLYVSEIAIDEPARAFSTRTREYIVLGTDYLEANMMPLRDVWSFLIARELGRLALGHVRWWDEILIAYVDRLPWIRRPLRHVRGYSRDHVAAFLEPEGVRGLVTQASGRRIAPTTNVAEHIRRAHSIDGFWVRVSNLVDEQAHLAERLRNLYRRGYFDYEHDVARFEGDPRGTTGRQEQPG